MIDERYLNELIKRDIKIFLYKIIPYIIFITVFLISVYFEFNYSEKTNIINDKLIDVSSIFFGIFIGCLYLFEKFKNRETYLEFLTFCKRLLYQNILIIFLSFIIILLDELPAEPLTLPYKLFETNSKIILFSFYISISAVTIFDIIRFIKVIIIIISSKK